MDEEEKHARLREIKLGNIRLIGDFFLHNIIPIKIITECFDFLLKKTDELNVQTLCELIKKIAKKLYFEDPSLLNKAYSELEGIYKNTADTSISSKTRFQVLDIIELKSYGWGIKAEDQLKKKDEFYTEIRSRKNSEIPHRSRRSSINPTNVEYIRRSRFNSRADELKINNDDNPGLMDELVSCLGSDIEFYQCFRLTEEEFVRISLISNLDIDKESMHEFDHRSPTREFKQRRNQRHIRQDDG